MICSKLFPAAPMPSGARNARCRASAH